MVLLISNALKYTDKGEVEFGCFIEEKGDSPVFFVKDTGSGIPPENVDTIFYAFEKRINPGLGLGLTLVSKIITAAGGHLWLESEPGKGSCFYFYLGDRK